MKGEEEGGSGLTPLRLAPVDLVRGRARGRGRARARAKVKVEW